MDGTPFKFSKAEEQEATAAITGVLTLIMGVIIDKWDEFPVENYAWSFAQSTCTMPADMTG